MKYRNRKTGATLETNSVISGGEWEPVEEKISSAEKPEVKEKVTKKAQTTRKKTKAGG